MIKGVLKAVLVFTVQVRVQVSYLLELVQVRVLVSYLLIFANLIIRYMISTFLATFTD